MTSGAVLGLRVIFTSQFLGCFFAQSWKAAITRPQDAEGIPSKYCCKPRLWPDVDSNQKAAESDAFIVVHSVRYASRDILR